MGRLVDSPLVWYSSQSRAILPSRDSIPAKIHAGQKGSNTGLQGMRQHRKSGNKTNYDSVLRQLSAHTGTEAPEAVGLIASLLPDLQVSRGSLDHRSVLLLVVLVGSVNRYIYTSSIRPVQSLNSGLDVYWATAGLFVCRIVLLWQVE